MHTHLCHHPMHHARPLLGLPRVAMYPSYATRKTNSFVCSSRLDCMHPHPPPPPPPPPPLPPTPLDAGLFSPYEHGETYVLDDGGEVDLDLGNYERFLDCTLVSKNMMCTHGLHVDYM